MSTHLVVFAGGTVTTCDEANLRLALQGGGQVNFGCDGTIVLSETLVIAAATVLDASGRNVALSGNSAVRIIHVLPGVTLRLKSLKLIKGRHVGDPGTPGDPNAGMLPGPGGRGMGGAIYNERGVLQLENCAIEENSVVGGAGGSYPFNPPGPGRGGDGLGGGVFTLEGEVHALRTVFTLNRANGYPDAETSTIETGSAFGGALSQEGGVVNLTECEFVSNHSATVGAFNRAAGSSAGGAIHVSSWNCNLIRCQFRSNSTKGGFAFRHGSGGTGMGGAVFNAGQLSANESLFESNLATGGGLTSETGSDGGGGAVANSGMAALEKCSFISNKARGGDGHSVGMAAAIYRGGNGDGGAILNLGNLEIINSTFWRNSAIGGAGADVSDLSTPNGHGRGGGIFHSGTSIQITHCTLAENHANAGTPGAGAQSLGGNISVASGSATLRNSILTASESGGNCSGQLTDQGNNISSDNTCPFTASGSKNNIDPKLGPLENYGGTTPTLPLLDGSPALDNALAAFCSPTDQRGVGRPFGAGCDIGAFESGPPFTIQGQVTGYRSSGGVVVEAGTSTATVGPTGTYFLRGLAPGNYTVTPNAPGIVFVPKNRDFAVGPDRIGANFRAYLLNGLVLERVGKSGLRVSFAGVAGQTYQLETSEDLTHWMVVTSFTLGSEAVFEFESNLSNLGVAYYRVKKN
ncbi:MAG: carboxypeptidase-like regulatory domain-containing protein [Verrucomicrobiota bacterium]